ncbi:MAG TPA: hypothetical protein VGY56_18260 [Verrucomicrobiae bacterium]|nr:hypothetical protein [Verrucomicrobiae bacterium]
MQSHHKKDQRDEAISITANVTHHSARCGSDYPDGSDGGEDADGQLCP